MPAPITPAHGVPATHMGMPDLMLLVEGLAILAFTVGPLVVFAVLLWRYNRRR